VGPNVSVYQICGGLSAKRTFSGALRKCAGSSAFWNQNRRMAVIILAVVLAVITGAYYFGRNLSRAVWLVLFILSVLALVLVLVAYRSIGI
jgi:cell division protein FtsW (lipid II flippase)